MTTIRIRKNMPTKLTPEQEETVKVLGECLDVREAAEKTGVPAGRIRYWLQNPIFLLAAQNAGYTAINIVAKKKHWSPEKKEAVEKLMDDSIERWNNSSENPNRKL